VAGSRDNTDEGRTFTAQTDCPRGDPENPVTVSDLEKKFKGLASPVVGEQMAGCLVTAISTVDTLSRASEMISCLKTPMSVT
jgi:2-methylcitrate dehydratase PrpD